MPWALALEPTMTAEPSACPELLNYDTGYRGPQNREMNIERQTDPNGFVADRTRQQVPLGESRLQDFPTNQYPPAWYHFATLKELARGPVKKALLGKSLIGFLTESGEPGVVSNHCPHMGSDLAGGTVVGESLQCSLHHWRFGTNGRCTHIPASDEIPDFAHLASYPLAVRQGNVYFFSGGSPDYPLPFFPGLEPDQLVAAKPFVETVECPWYMIGANAIDTQHFAIAHDRRLQCIPQVDNPTPLAHRTICHFEVIGNSLGDRVTKRFGGAHVRLEITDWCGTLVLAHSTLAKTESFGLVAIIPLSPTRTQAHVTVMARAGKEPVRRLVDPLRAAIRRYLIRDFLRSDVHRMAGTRFSPHTLIDIDQPFADYFHWLGGIISRPTRGSE